MDANAEAAQALAVEGAGGAGSRPRPHGPVAARHRPQARAVAGRPDLEGRRSAADPSAPMKDTKKKKQLSDWSDLTHRGGGGRGKGVPAARPPSG